MPFIYMFLKSFTHRLMDLHTLINKSLFRKYRIFCGFQNYTNHIFSNLTYELTNISYVDVFPKYLYSQVTGKRKSNMK